MDDDPELAAMAAIAGALKDLDQDAVERVLEWAAKRHAVTLTTARPGGTGNVHAASEEQDPPEDDGPNNGLARGNADDGDYSEQFDDIVDFYSAADPQNDLDRVLVVAYWLDTKEGVRDFKSFQIQNPLKDMGHGLSNVTKVTTRAMEAKPAYLRQIAKPKTKQGRKTYRLTEAGKKRVQSLLRGEGDE